MGILGPTESICFPEVVFLTRGRGRGEAIAYPADSLSFQVVNTRQKIKMDPWQQSNHHVRRTSTGSHPSELFLQDPRAILQETLKFGAAEAIATG